MTRTTKMSHTTQTTTLIVTRPADFSLLEARFRLMRYELPAVLYRRKNKNDYGRMHNCLRDQLDYPYKVFTHDKMVSSQFLGERKTSDGLKARCANRGGI